MQDEYHEFCADGHRCADEPIKPCGLNALGLTEKVNAARVDELNIEQIVTGGGERYEPQCFKLSGLGLAQMLVRHSFKDAAFGIPGNKPAQVFLKTFQKNPFLPPASITRREQEGKKRRSTMTILDTSTDTGRIERLHQLVDQLSDDQRAEVLALVTGMVMQAQLTARKAG